VHKVVQAVQAVPVVPVLQTVQAVPAPPAMARAPDVPGVPPLAPHALSQTSVQQSPLAQYHSACQAASALETGEPAVPGVAQQEQLERQRMLAEEEEANSMQVNSGSVSLDLPGVMQMQQDTGSSAVAPAAAISAWDGMEATAGEESWAEQVMSNDWIHSFDEQTSLSADERVEHSISPLTQAGLQRLIEDVH